MLTLYLEYLVSKYDAKTIIHLRIRTELHFRFLTEIIGMMAYQIYSDGNVKYYLSIIIDCELLLTTVTQFATMPDAFNRHFSLLNVTAAGACGYDFPCDGERLVRAYLRRRRGTI